MAFHVVKGFQSHGFNNGKSRLLPLNDNDMKLRTNFNNTYVIIRLPHFRVLRLIARSIVLALFFASFSTLRTFLGASVSSTPTHFEPEAGYDSIDAKKLSILFHDLTNQGLLKTGEKAVFLGNGNGNGNGNVVSFSQVLSDYGVKFISIGDLETQNAIAADSLDFAFIYPSSGAKEFVDRTLKVGGVAVVQLSSEPHSSFRKPSHYNAVDLEISQSDHILALRKTGSAGSHKSSYRRLLGFDNEARKAALTNLEDVLLEPPRAASRKSSRYLKRTKYLPDLIGDSLESYRRRVFIDVGLPEREGGSGTAWFADHYPTRNLDFEIYKIESMTEESSGKEVPQLVEEEGMSEWLEKNVKAEEYVVMKAEAEVVEEMMKSKVIRLVDELFLECKPKSPGRKGRAYWECLSLYGRLRDEGVAVHQWWG